jgi:hypothetical protein
MTQGGVLVGPNGMTLYTFDKDTAGSGKSVCNGPCATNWPPLMAGTAASCGRRGLQPVVTRDDGSQAAGLQGQAAVLLGQGQQARRQDRRRREPGLAHRHTLKARHGRRMEHHRIVEQRARDCAATRVCSRATRGPPTIWCRTRWSAPAANGCSGARGSNLRAWLFTLMHHLYLNQRRGAPPSPALDIDTLHEGLAAPPSGTDDALDLERCLQRVPPEQRAVLLLVSMEDLSYEEVASVLAIPVGTVMSRLSRARSRLRELLDAPAGDLAARPAASGAPTLRRLK